MTDLQNNQLIFYVFMENPWSTKVMNLSDKII